MRAHHLKQMLRQTRKFGIKFQLNPGREQCKPFEQSFDIRVGAFKVIDPAISPELRSRPKRALIVVASGLLGGFFGLFLCFVFHFVESAKRQNELA